MGKVVSSGASIQLDQIADDEPLPQQLATLHPGDSVVLEVGGFVGRWRRTPTNSIEPLDQNIRDAWTTMAAKPHAVDSQLVTTDGSHLVTFGVRGQLWDDPASQYR